MQSPEEVSPQEVSKCLEPSMAELEDSPNQASPVPRKSQEYADSDDETGGTETKKQLASIIHVRSSHEPLERSSEGPECPVRPFSASENIRWEVSEDFGPGLAVEYAGVSPMKCAVEGDFYMLGESLHRLNMLSMCCN
jgi:hypothetical protein